jgi:hypothetical protein
MTCTASKPAASVLAAAHPVIGTRESANADPHV